MTKLKLGAIPDNKPVKLTADVHRDLCDYATVLGQQTGQDLEPARLVAPMLARFMATDREFARMRRGTDRQKRAGSGDPRDKKLP